MKNLLKTATCIAISALLALSPINALRIGSLQPDQHEDVKYISVDEYIEKYGRENVIRGFNQAAAENMRTVLSIGSEQADAMVAQSRVLEQSNEPGDVYLSLMEGKFLGLPILGIADLSPDNVHMTLWLDDSSMSRPEQWYDPGSTDPVSIMNTAASNSIRHYPNYDVYYSDNEPTNFASCYEPLSGSYFYKFSYSYDQSYMCSTEVTFSNTQLKCGSQSCNMYVYVNAMSNIHSIDFGLMANPSGDERNKGMYACRTLRNDNQGKKDDEIDINEKWGLVAETLPKVAATYSANNTMVLENKTVEIKLAVTGDRKVEAYMGINGTCVYYNIFNSLTGMVSGTAAPLTFLQAMSCVAVGSNEDVSTELTSGSYFTNVTFNNTTLYSDLYGARPFGMYGIDTYFVFVCKPSKLSLNYGSNSETISIVYN